MAAHVYTCNIDALFCHSTGVCCLRIGVVMCVDIYWGVSVQWKALTIHPGLFSDGWFSDQKNLKGS